MSNQEPRIFSVSAENDSLRAERDKLRAEVERHKQTIHTLECDIRDARENRDKYRAEVERLRKNWQPVAEALAGGVDFARLESPVDYVVQLREELGEAEAEVERLRAEANARAVEELALQAEGCDMAASGWVCEREHAKDNAHRDRLESRIDQLRGVAFHIRRRIAELSKPAAKESEPSRCAERVWASGDMEACGKPLPCSDHSAKESEPAKDETKCGKVVAYVNGEPALCDAAKGHPFSCSRVVSVPKPVTGPNYLDQEEWGHAKPEDPAKGGEKIETWVDDWTVSLADEAKATHAEEPAEEASAKLLAMVVEGLCNLGREVRRGGKL